MVNRSQKLLVFHQALAPYRVDFWNSLDKLYNMDLYFMYTNLLDQKFDQDRLKSQLHFTCHYHKKGFRLGVRAFRWGFSPLIRKQKPDIVFTYEYSQTTLSLYFIKKIFGFKYKLYTICDDSLHIAENCSGMRKLIRNFIVRRLDGVIVVNDKVANWYNNNNKLKHPAIVFPIITREDLFREKLQASLPIANNFIKQYALAGKKCILFVGRLVAVKGVDRLIMAFAKLKQTQPDAVLLLVGDGDDREKLRSKCVELNISASVIFTGRFEGNELYAWYTIGQVFALASHYEPFGAVVNEALIAGMPVICSENAGAADLITPGYNGETFPPYDIDQLASILNNSLQKIQPVETVTELRPSLMTSGFEAHLKNLYESLSTS